jgi:hypothetical protein
MKGNIWVYIIIYGILGIVFMGSVSGAIGELKPQQVNTNVTLPQYSDSATYQNISSVLVGNGTLVILNVQMTKNGNDFSYILNSSYTTSLGKYCVNGYGDDADDTTWNYCFNVTPTGTDIETGSSLIYGFLLFILLLFIYFWFYVIFSLDLQNERDEVTGQLLGISLKKYIKMVMIGVSYGLILLTLNLMVALSESIQQISQFSGIIGSIFSIMLSLTWVWTLCIIIWIAVVAFNDGKLLRDLKRMLKETEGMYE